MPTLPLIPREVEQNPEHNTATPYGEHESDTRNSSLAWVIPTVVAGLIVVTAFLVYALLSYNKRRQFRKEQEKDPYLTPNEFSRRRRMTAQDRVEEEEKQRVIMIRKSLASRSWGSMGGDSRRTSQISQTSQPNPPGPPSIRVEMHPAEQHPAERHPAERHPAERHAEGRLAEERHLTEDMDEDDEPVKLKDEWKAWEAGLRRERSMSGDRHPAASDVPDLTMPPQSRSRSRSPSRSPLLKQLPSTPPPYPG
ncbi:hypothetical protein B0T25DRAFT_518427 [Lasiosphaeria hispida]|uniref:Uncharacterized protein n=1 Tax=Lasiosphaeria hispida TaxID=260671 RepID=A0AAJ0HIH1_9PEZI|nr:hypothetical protein B0T25DRAFT_518427 [Lasiosphaeria hispida]